MSWRSYIYPQTLATFSSPYNSNVVVQEYWGKMKILVNGSVQSGPYVKKLWGHALSKFKIAKKPVKNILVLGVAGGTVIYLLKKNFPDAVIVSVDIDPQMIEAGKRYFGLDKIKNHSMICMDAEKFIKGNKSKFDLILIDAFSGRHPAPFLLEKNFYELLKKNLTKNGAIIINYLRELQYKEKSNALRDLLFTIFPVIKETSIYHNRFFLVNGH